MAADAGQPPLLERPFFAAATIAPTAAYPKLGHGDLWPSCWSDDDGLYTAAGDGFGFGPPLLQNDVLIARLDGRPGDADFRGTQLAVSDQVSQVWSGPSYNRKPTGMLCIDGDLYVAVQDLRINTFSDAPAATIARSSDKGVTWTWDPAGPMFSDWKFTTIMFLDFGKDAEHAPSDYVYAYGQDDNWSFQSTRGEVTKLFLARMPRGSIQDRSRWEFFSGLDAGEPRWTSDIAARAPVLEDARRVFTQPLAAMPEFQNMTVINQGGVVYDAPLDRYIYSTWTEYTLDLYEAPTPWGPFQRFHTRDVGAFPWSAQQNGGYGTTIPSKFISDDGLSMLLQSSCWESTGYDNYAFSLREVHVVPSRDAPADNPRDGSNLATSAVPYFRAARGGSEELMRDGITTESALDSWSGERKSADFWGFLWASPQRVNTLRYTTGAVSSAGGWFDELHVQVRRGGVWVDVEQLQTEPSYPASMELSAFTTFTFRFDEVAADGVCIFGKPGGSDSYTSLAELSVHYE